ncbi:MAG: hypothetical protein HY959_05940 [Ignavibacteriae bacterium]|nr:hypothetical protein [Ignavibacteriota bacterium]
MSRIFIALFLLLLSINCYSNDSGIIAIGGTWIVMKDEHPSVQMESEKIEMNVYADYYDVTAEFIFKNIGGECSVYMGFPESGFGDMNSYKDSVSAFLKFSTEVDGIMAEVRRERVRGEFNDYDAYLAYWIKEVSFKEGQMRKVTVKYRSPLGTGISAFYNGTDNFVRYTFSGGNWQGKVTESNLKIYFHIPVEVRPNEKFDLKKVGDHYEYNRTFWEAEEYFGVVFKIKD